MNSRVEALERKLRETDGIVDALLAEAEYTPSIDLGMNGQHRRKEVVSQLFEELELRQVIETGTFLGATTGYFAAEFGVPVFTSELVPRNHHFSRRLLRNLDDVSLYLQDSRSFLRLLAGQSERTNVRSFFYLDAHWYDDLPLADEIDLIAPAWNDYVILIDDFRVPGDEGYQYDDYGPGKCLDVDYLKPLVDRHSLTLFFPVATSGEETGKCRGYCVLSSPSLASSVRGCGLLREWEEG